MGHHLSRELPDDIKDKYPHYKEFRECQSKAFTHGMYTFVTAGATLYIVQEMIKKYLPYDRKAFLVVPVLGGCFVSYTFTRRRTEACQNMWMAMEEKHTALSPISDSTTTEKIS